MKRLTLEFPYQELWRRVFGPNYDRVEILEAVKSLKCDFEGLAVICRIRFRDKRMKATDLVGKGAIRSVETLYKDNDGSLTVFVEGRPVVHAPKQMHAGNLNRTRPHLVAAGPPEFVDRDRMRVRLLCRDEEVPRILDFYERTHLPHTLVEVSRFESVSDSDLSRLTAKQRQALLAAYSLGYYDVPRRISSEQLAKRLNVGTSTYAEHLRKAERGLLSSVLSR
ncbi:MAG TPA: helix-turn-helix domain-containing protein [Candidatus Bathyarchaeia archaeon]|nr:helix-turn-helix domain-containing protein [Candidatus Bathyarchaeia archaeon]